ncbi:transposase (fragment) [Vibrio nigripulchritudo MADA3029]
MSNRSCFGGIDLANNHFIIPAVNSNGKVILHKSEIRPNLLTKLTNIPPKRIGLEACGGAHCGG